MRKETFVSVESENICLTNDTYSTLLQCIRNFLFASPSTLDTDNTEDILNDIISQIIIANKIIPNASYSTEVPKSIVTEVNESHSPFSLSATVKTPQAQGQDINTQILPLDNKPPTPLTLPMLSHVPVPAPLITPLITPHSESPTMVPDMINSHLSPDKEGDVCSFTFGRLKEPTDQCSCSLCL